MISQRNVSAMKRGTEILYPYYAGVPSSREQFVKKDGRRGLLNNNISVGKS